MGWDEAQGAQMRCDEMRWSVECEVPVSSVESGAWWVQVWSVKKVFAWSCIAPGSRAGHVLGQQQRNRFAESTHSACKFYRLDQKKWHRWRQLPPRLVRILLVTKVMIISKMEKDTVAVPSSNSHVRIHKRNWSDMETTPNWSWNCLPAPEWIPFYHFRCWNLHQWWLQSTFVHVLNPKNSTAQLSRTDVFV